MTDTWRLLICISLALGVSGVVGALYGHDSSATAYNNLRLRVLAVEQPVCSPMMEVASEGIVGCVLAVVGDISVFRSCYSRRAVKVPSSGIRPTTQTCADEPHPEAR